MTEDEMAGWTWAWVNSGSWCWTGRLGVLRFMGSQRVRHDWATELNWTELNNHILWEVNVIEHSDFSAYKSSYTCHAHSFIVSGCCQRWQHCSAVMAELSSCYRDGLAGRVPNIYSLVLSSQTLLTSVRCDWFCKCWENATWILPLLLEGLAALERK